MRRGMSFYAAIFASAALISIGIFWLLIAWLGDTVDALLFSLAILLTLQFSALLTYVMYQFHQKR